MSHIFAPAVYLLCFFTSTICAVMLGRSFHRTRTKLLFWSAMCFSLLAINNLLLVLDLVVLPNRVDLALPRILVSLAAVATLLFGFIWDAGE
ncbi:MAG TPA: DUF5985 family protein [Frateuria sp.]|uniref:DUF5985 family protein n=1 Tax=Frateuria sp. TaxID=2211372 RepID=UPI002D7E3582|nr:DUF5985 family protein [Frateuria sp.]HET6807189.1 DUF5985 family protein [Frateuria sp.]